MFAGFTGRRDPMPMFGGRPHSEYGISLAGLLRLTLQLIETDRMGGMSRHHSISDYDGVRSHSSSSLQSYYHNQRHSRPHNDMDSVMQAKRRMAAQRERELRNYHQEQQYNRSEWQMTDFLGLKLTIYSGVLADMSGAKSDRSASPGGMTEEDRRELIARQHRALYGNEASLYGAGASTRPVSQDARVAAGVMRPGGNSPLNYEQYPAGTPAGVAEQMQAQSKASKDASVAGQQQRSRANSTASPSSNPNAFSLFDTAQQSSHTSTSSPGGSPPRQGASKSSTTAGVGAIGMRPTQNQTQAANTGLTKRSTTPLPSPLSYGYPTTEKNQNNNNNSISVSNSNPPSAVPEKGTGFGWPGNNGVWGAAKNPLSVQASVWG